MKKIYDELELEITLFSKESVLEQSGGFDIDDVITEESKQNPNDNCN